ncbi:hypothetical protein QBZ16_000239 [Prototheca wickerhamii]|uniref:Methyltransferase FkbM domain-containing protein n=1 Tax=Prototheca wickerhamii TaxID=3111 RepID=A0AAD9MP58_PROWI|nr:hypothetical protein QBZ16_000239 [Prototheca wickerhamii]
MLMTVHVRQTKSMKRFRFAFTDPEVDIDVSRHVRDTGVLEIRMHRLWNDLLLNCSQPDARFVDVGGNFGWYSVMAAVYGCRVTAWEPVPRFAAFFKYNMLLNNVTHLIDLREKIVSDKDGDRLVIRVPAKGILGTAGIDGANIDANNELESIERETERLDTIIKGPSTLLKVDVEGFEPQGLIQANLLPNILFEYSPGVFERVQDMNRTCANPEVLMAFVNAGYELFDLSNVEHAPGFERQPIYNIPAAVLRNDLEDCLGWNRCNVEPSGLHPQSYRPTFTFNTNIWATKRRAPGWQPKGVAALIPPEADLLHTYYVSDKRPGPGGWPCTAHWLDPKTGHPVDISAFRVDKW